MVEDRGLFSCPWARGEGANQVRRLHPVSRADTLIDQGAYDRPAGGVERFSLHADAAGRRTLRVEVLPAGDLWHLALSPEGRPERVECRWQEDGAVFEAALTCFEDELLVWRRGAEPISERIDLPPGYRLLWPPVAGRGECLAGLEAELDDRDRGARIFLSLRRRPLAKGGLRCRPIKLGLRREALAASSGPTPQGPAPLDPAPPRAAPPRAARRIALETPGLPAMQAEFDAAGRLLRWLEDGQPVAERRAEPEIPD